MRYGLHKSGWTEGQPENMTPVACVEALKVVWFVVVYWDSFLGPLLNEQMKVNHTYLAKHERVGATQNR